MNHPSSDSTQSGGAVPINASRSIRGNFDWTRARMPADKLVGLVRDRARLFTAPDDSAWAAIEIGNHRESWPLASRGFKTWLANGYYLGTQKAPMPEAMSQALLTLDAVARFEGRQEPVCLRTGEQGGKLYLDLADEDWRAIEISPEGWRVIDRHPMHFRRQRGMLPLALPVPGGEMGELRRFLNVASDDDFLLAVAWLIAALRPSGPFPLLALVGEPGSAKSTTARILRSLVDPNISALRSAPKDERDCWIGANNAAILAYDNLSSIPIWMSDALCRIATGGGFATRQLHTDCDEILIEAVRPVILTSVGDVIAQSDLADRAIVLDLPTISNNRRRHEGALGALFAAAKPRILGALLDAVATGLRRQPDIILESLPRLADFAVWVTACETAFAEDGDTLAAYYRNIHEAVDSVVQNDAVCVATLAFLDANHGHWKGKPETLLADIRVWAPEGAPRERGWPRNPQTLSNRLRLAAPSLRKMGVLFGKGKTAGKRYLELIRE